MMTCFFFSETNTVYISSIILICWTVLCLYREPKSFKVSVLEIVPEVQYFRTFQVLQCVPYLVHCQTASLGHGSAKWQLAQSETLKAPRIYFLDIHENRKPNAFFVLWQHYYYVFVCSTLNF